MLPVLTCIAILVPGHMLGWGVEWAWLATMVVVCALGILPRPWDGSTLGLSVQVWALTFAVLSGVTALSVMIVLLRQEPINERDIAEMLRLPIYGLMTCFFAIRIGPGLFPAINTVTRLAVLFSLTCVVIYQTQLPLLYPVLELIYAEAKVLFGAGVIRAPFPFENPNFLAYFLVLALSYFCFLRRSIIYMMLTIVLLFLTGSRSGWLAAIPVVACFALAQTIGSGAWRKVASIGALTLGFVATVVFWDQLKSFARVAELINALQGGDLQGVETARIRLDGVYHMLDWIERSPIFGWGPGRALELDVADNQYLSWIVAWGILGFGIITLIGTTVFLHLWRAAPDATNKLAVISLLSGIGLMLITGDFLENYRLFFITLAYLHVFYESLQAGRAHQIRVARPVHDGLPSALPSAQSISA